MAFNKTLANRIREALAIRPDATEKFMFGGICFMVDEKMCMGVVKDELMCRIDPQVEEEVLEKEGVRPMDFTGKRMKGYVFVSEEVLQSKKQIAYWVALCLEYNKLAKKSKKK